MTHKLAMLMALANADRCSDLAALDLTKTRRSGPPLEAFSPALHDEPRLCPVQMLHSYMGKTKQLRADRSDGQRNLPFITVWKPHHRVKPATIEHWLKW